MNRRRFLRRTGALGVLGLAGCTSDANDDQRGDGGVGAQSGTDTPSPTPDPTPTETATQTATQTETETPADIGDNSTSGSSGSRGWAAGGTMNGISFSFTSYGPECGSATDTTDVRFQPADGQVVVEGTIRGSDVCTRAALGSVEYSESDDRLRIAIETVDIEDCKEDGGMGAQCTTDIEYDAQFRFDGDLPGEATVSHDGDAIATAGHDSASAAPPSATEQP